MSTTTAKVYSRVNSDVRGVASGKTPQSPTATSTIIPGPNPGERLASYFDKFFATVIGISTLGASITFSKVISTPVRPWIDYGYDETTIQVLMGIAWLLFVMALILTSLFASLLNLYRPQAIEAFATKDHYNKNKTMWAATAVSLLLFLLILASFIFLSLVTAAYVGPVGWTALGITSSFGFLGLAGIIWQSPLGWPDWVLKLLPRTGKDEPFANRHTGIGLGFDGKVSGSTWPISRKDSYITRLRKEASRRPKTNDGSNLTGGLLPSSLRKKYSHPDLFEEKDFAVDVAPPTRLEDSFTTDKEWESFRSAGGRTMRMQPRVSWPREGVVSNQISPPPPQYSQPSETQTQRRQPREYKHDRRERLQQQHTQQQQQPQPAQSTQDPQAQLQRLSSYSGTSTVHNNDDEYYDSQDDHHEEDAVAQNQQYEQQQQHDVPLSHPLINRAHLPPARRSAAHRPVWELEQWQQQRVPEDRERGGASRFDAEDDLVAQSWSNSGAYGA